MSPKIDSGVQIRVGEKVDVHSIIFCPLRSSAISGKYKSDMLLRYKVDVANTPAKSFLFKLNGPADIEQH